jgi:hypothetical protein
VERSLIVGLGNGTQGGGGCLGAVFVWAELAEPLLDPGGGPPAQVARETFHLRNCSFARDANLGCAAPPHLVPNHNG